MRTDDAEQTLCDNNPPDDGNNYIHTVLLPANELITKSAPVMKSESKVSFALAHRKRLATVMDISLRALEEALGIRREIDRLEKRLAAIFGNSALPSSAGKGRREMSAATRAKIAAAARARWAKRKAHQTVSKPAKKKGGLTPAGRKKLTQLMKARWAARRKAAAKK